MWQRAAANIISNGGAKPQSENNPAQCAATNVTCNKGCEAPKENNLTQCAATTITAMMRRSPEKEIPQRNVQ